MSTTQDEKSLPSSLFRAEVMRARQVQWLGSIRIGRPPSFAWVTGISLLLAAALITFSIWGEVTRKAKLPGLLVPTAGMLNLSAPQAGVVSDLLVKEGELVQAGQVLLRLKTERSTALGDAGALNAQALAQRRATLETEALLTRQQGRQRAQALNDRVRSLQAEERQAQGELEAHQLRVALALKSQDRFTELAAQGFVSQLQVQQKQEDLLDLQLRERNTQRSLQALQREAQSLRAEMVNLQTSEQTSLAQLERGIASLSQEATENDARNGLVIKAPQAGRVSALTWHVGQSVQAGQTLLGLVPESPSDGQVLEAQLYAPSRTAGFVRQGQTVWLRYAAYPYQKFGMAEGVVDSVSQTPIAAQDLPSGQSQALMNAAQSNEPLYRIGVRLKAQAITTYGRAQVLKVGMALDADVLQDKRAVWEWLLEPVLAAGSHLRILSAAPVAKPGLYAIPCGT